jgi:DNA (cytosine-5)-methyltransferase 1
VTGLTFGSLFAGVGGFDLGFESAGYECRFQVEWDPHCQQTLAYRWPQVPRWSDVSQVSGAELPPAHVITYGFPCQDLSTAGKRAGLDGKRSHLFFEAVRIIREMREATDGRYPVWVVAENVAGLLTADRGSAMARVVDELAEAGSLVVEWVTLDAQWFGVPQRRRRTFIAACLDPATAYRCPDPLFPVCSSDARHPQQAPGNGEFVFYRTHGRHDQVQYEISPPLKTVTSVCVAGGDSVPRTLTPTEHERLMGWPDDHTLHRADGKTNSDSVRYKMCGNGVVAPVARWVGKHLAATMEPS